jgi:CspA family cold shock protein
MSIQSQTHQSTVKWFDAKKGYGFINHPEGGDDIFVHYSQIETDDDFKTLRTGQSVRFEMDDGPKGLHALNVLPVEAEETDEPEEVDEPEEPDAPSPESSDNDAASSFQPGEPHARRESEGLSSRPEQASTSEQASASEQTSTSESDPPPHTML